MYSIDGVALQNSSYGWRLKRVSSPNTDVSAALAEFNASGRDGTIRTRGFLNSGKIALVVTTPLAYLDELRQLFRLGASLSRTADGSKTQAIDFVQMSVESVSLPGAGLYQVTASFRAPEVFWRDASVTTVAAQSVTSSGQLFTLFTASTAPIRDLQFTIRGTVSNVTVVGSLGTYWNYSGSITSSQYLTFDSATGRTYIDSTPFGTGTIASAALVNNGPGPYFLELIGQSNPAIPGKLLTVSYGSAGAGSDLPTISFRGRGAYDL